MNNTMAIFKATYTKSRGGAKAAIRYLEHRPGSNGQKITRTLFNGDGALTRQETYRMIDAAQKGSRFFRFVLSPDQKTEDTKRDLSLREITQATMDALSERLGLSHVHYVAAIHADHTDCRHVHIVAIVPGRLQAADLKALRQIATTVSLQQRQQLDLAYGQHRQKEAEWGLSY